MDIPLDNSYSLQLKQSICNFNTSKTILIREIRKEIEQIANENNITMMYIGWGAFYRGDDEAIRNKEKELVDKLNKLIDISIEAFGKDGKRELGYMWTPEDGWHDL